MTQEEIRQKREELEARIRELNRQITHVEIDLKHLQADCDHPNMTHGYVMGESSGSCPDCGFGW